MKAPAFDYLRATSLPQVFSLLQQHGDIQSLGFRFGDFAYCSDVSDFPDETVAKLAGLEVLVIERADGSRQTVTLTLRIDTPIEVDYYRHGGILPFVLRQLLAA